MWSSCPDRRDIKKLYIYIYLLTEIYLRERNSALLFPTQIIFEIFESLICLCYQFVAPNALLCVLSILDKTQPFSGVSFNEIP